MRSILLVVFLFALRVEANQLQEAPIMVSTIEEKSEPSPWTLSTYFEIPTYSILISTDEGRVSNEKVSQRVQYNPTFGPNLGIGGSYKGLSLSWSQRLSFIDEEERKTYGKTDYQDWKMAFNFPYNLKFEAYYRNYQGLYADLSGKEGLQTTIGEFVETSSTASPNQSSIVNRPDLTAISYGARVTHAFPLTPIFDFFSMDNTTPLFEMNFLTKAYYNHNSLRGDRPLVPDAVASSFSPIASLKYFSTQNLGAGLGLGMWLNMTANSRFGFDGMVGFAMQHQQAEFAERSVSSIAGSQEANFNLAYELKKKNHFLRSHIYFDSQSSEIEGMNLDSMGVGFVMAYTYQPNFM